MRPTSLIPWQTTNPIRFGWWSTTHRALIEGALNRLPDQTAPQRRWKQFLLNNQAAIQTADDFQDQAMPGMKPSHIIDVFEHGNATALARGDIFSRSAVSLWQDAVKHINPSTLRIRQQELASAPLTIASLKDHSNVFSQAWQTFQRLQLILNAAATHPIPTEQINLLSLMPQLLGALTHYVADGGMPCHAASGTAPDWPLSHVNKHTTHQYEQGIHRFIEAEVMDDSLQSPLKSSTQRPIGEGTYDITPLFNHRVAPLMMDSAQLLWPIMACHRQRLKKGLLNDSMGLKTDLQQQLSPHLQRIQVVMAEVLYNVWANNPNREAVDTALTSLYPAPN